MDLKELMARADTLADDRDAIDEELGRVRVEIRDALLGLGVTGAVGNGTRRYSIARPKPGIQITNRDRLISWAQERYPTEIEIHTSIELRPAFAAKLWAEVIAGTATDQDVLESTRVTQGEPYLMAKRAGEGS